jgi:phospholipase C
MDRFIDDPKLSTVIVDLNEYFRCPERNLPAVAFIALGSANTRQEPAGWSEAGTVSVSELMRSDLWYSSAFMWAYDDWGGWYDHVPPPQVDDYGYGFRVPALLVSAYARRGYVDSTELDYTSILKFIEENWGLEPLAERDAKANSMANAFDFSQTPSEPALVSPERGTEQAVKPRRAVIYGAYSAALVVPLLVIAWAALGPVLFRRRATGSSAHLAQDGDEW